MSRVTSRVAKVVSCLVLAIAMVIAICEWRDPSPQHWWRKVAEISLTKFSAYTPWAIGLSASKSAFKLRKGYSNPRTVVQLAESAERQKAYSLSGVARVYLAQKSNQADERLGLARDAFRVAPSELTAWQYASYLESMGKAVPPEVSRVLSSGANWEYARIRGIDRKPDVISKSVRASHAIADEGLFQLAEVAGQAEVAYTYWSQTENRQKRVRVLTMARDGVKEIASRNLLFDGVLVGFVDFLQRKVQGIIDILNDPGSSDLWMLTFRLGRRALNVVDTLHAVVAAKSEYDRILKARVAVEALETEIWSLKSGRFLESIRTEMTNNRVALGRRVERLLSDHRRYTVDPSLVLLAIEGGDPNQAFLASAVARLEPVGPKYQNSKSIRLLPKSWPMHSPPSPKAVTP